MNVSQDPLLVVLLGPTASGKTNLSLRLARLFHGEVVSCDSVAVYRDFEIGTAKPTLAERREIPHHLIDVASPEHFYSAGQYSRDARLAITQITTRGHLPIITGGTGLYLRALLQGLFAAPQRSEAVRDRLRAIESRRGTGHLHRILQRLDRDAATGIHPRDTPKLIRAIEVTLALGTPITEAWRAAEHAPLSGYSILRIGLNPDRQRLYARINSRASAMFAGDGPADEGGGLMGETRMLMERYSPSLKVFDTLGYRHAAAHLRGHLTRDAAIEQARQGHRNYAKRQLTWFRREPDVHWLIGFGDDDAIALQAVDLVRARI